MLSLIKSSQFQKEYKDFFDKIDKIDNNNPVKKELSSLLNQLVQEVKHIDVQHQELTLTQNISSSINDSKSKIFEIRKKLSRKLVESNQA